MRFSALPTALLLLAAPASASSQQRRQRNDTAGGGRYLADISAAVSALTEEIWPISQEIHANPELGYDEVRAHRLLTDYVAGKDGWEVTRGAYGISTAFVASFDGGFGDGPTVSFNAEYDALRDMGHACGHNLIAASSLAGALAEVVAKLENAVRAGALGTGATYNMTKRWGGYSAMVNNNPLAAAYKRNFESLGGRTPDAEVEKARSAAASSDQGNVSEELPAIQPVFGIFDEDGRPTASAPHTPDFRGAAGSRKSFDKAMRVATALAGVAVDVLTVDGMLEKVKEDFAKETAGSGVQQLRKVRRGYLETHT